MNGGTQFGLSEIQLFPPSAPETDWIYSVPDAIARETNGTERKRVYLGIAHWGNLEFYDVVGFNKKNTFIKYPVNAAGQLSSVFHGQGVPREFLAVEVDFPLGGGGQIIAVDEISVNFLSDLAGLATVSVRRLF